MKIDKKVQNEVSSWSMSCMWIIQKNTIVLKDLEYGKIDQWDSIAHMTLMSDLENEFKITFENDDIIDFSSYKKGKEILKKFNIII